MYTSDIQTYLEVNEFPAYPYIGETFDLLVYDNWFILSPCVVQ